MTVISMVNPICVLQAAWTAGPNQIVGEVLYFRHAKYYQRALRYGRDMVGNTRSAMLTKRDLVARSQRGAIMPKEVVQYPRTDGNSGTEVSVHWDKDQGYVQLGVTRHVWMGSVPEDGRRHIDHDYCGECERQSKCPNGCDGETTGCTECSSPEQSDFVEEPVSVFTDLLTRQQINTMIRVLRRARDQAHGKDE